MKSLLTQLRQEMEAGIKAVLKGEKKTFKTFLPITPKMVKVFLINKGWEAGDMETNGWEYDWWVNFTKDEQAFTAFGCGHDGGFEFYPTEE